MRGATLLAAVVLTAIGTSSMAESLLSSVDRICIGTEESAEDRLAALEGLGFTQPVSDTALRDSLVSQAAMSAVYIGMARPGSPELQAAMAEAGEKVETTRSAPNINIYQMPDASAVLMVTVLSFEGGASLFICNYAGLPSEGGALELIASSRLGNIIRMSAESGSTTYGASPHYSPDLDALKTMISDHGWTDAKLSLDDDASTGGRAQDMAGQRYQIIYTASMFYRP